jgi:WD40 repeat protein
LDKEAEMSHIVKKVFILLIGGLYLFAFTGCAGQSETLSPASVSQPAGTTASTPAGIEVIRQPTAEAVPTNSDGFAPGDLEVITPENANRLQELAVIGPGRFGSKIVVSPDGASLAVTAHNGVLFYDPVSGDLEDFYPTSSEVIDMAVSPDGQRVAVVTLIESDEYYPSTAPSPDSFITHPVLAIWDRSIDEVVLTQPLSGRGCGEYYVNDLQFSPDSTSLVFRDKYFLLGFTETDNICVVSAEDGSLQQSIPVESAWMPYGQGIAFADEGENLITAISRELERSISQRSL